MRKNYEKWLEEQLDSSHERLVATKRAVLIGGKQKADYYAAIAAHDAFRMALYKFLELEEWYNG